MTQYAAALSRMMPVLALLLVGGCQRVEREPAAPRTARADSATLVARPDSAPATAAAAWTRVAGGEPAIDALFVVTRDRGIREGLDSLGALTSRDPAAAGRGHELAHALGRFAAASRGDISILGECTPVFQSGCYHGALEGLFMRGATVDGATVGAICGPGAPGRPGYERLECWHGLGHGLMVRFGGDHKQALPLCDALQTPRGRRECQDGVYMERAIRAIGASSTDVDAPADAQAHAGHGGGGAHGEHGGHAAPAAESSGALSNEELQRLCAAEEAPHQPSCWAYQPIALLQIYNSDPAAVLAACDRAPAHAVRACYQGFGKQYLGAMRGKVPPMIEGCRAGNPAFLADCLLGGVEYFTDIQWDVQPGIRFCARVPSEAKDRCYELIGERLALAHPARRDAEAACRRVERRHVQACLSGTRRNG